MAIGVGFRIFQAVFEALYGEEIPNRKDISILSGHGGPGFRDAFEFVTRAQTRGTIRSILLIQKLNTIHIVQLLMRMSLHGKQEKRLKLY